VWDGYSPRTKKKGKKHRFYHWNMGDVANTGVHQIMAEFIFSPDPEFAI